MYCVVCEEPGRLRYEPSNPVRSAADDAIIRVRRVGVCGTDMHIFRGTQPYLNYPRVMGHEIAAEVVKANEKSGLVEGDQVCVLPYISCGECAACGKGIPNCCMRLEVLGVHRDGGLTQTLALPPRFLLKAADVSLDEAALVEFLSIGAHAVRRAGVKPADSVLVVGAGPIGLAAALFALRRGANVTMLDPRADRLAFARRLGVHTTLPVDTDTRGKLAALTSGNFFDVVFDATGSAAAIEQGLAYVGHGGRYALISVVNANITFSDPEFHKRETTLLACRNATLEDFALVLQTLRDDHTLAPAFITHRCTLAELPEALPRWMDPSTGVIKAVVEV